MTERRKSRLWSIEELRVLAAIYFNSSFSIGDDARDECRAIADAFGRTPSSIDRQWRNLHAVVCEKSESYNIGRLVRETAAEYLTHPLGSKAVALRICEANQWPLVGLIEEGAHEPLQTAGADRRYPELMIALEALCRAVQFRAYPKSFGFEVEDRIELSDGRVLLARVQAIYIASDPPDPLAPRARAYNVGEALAALVPDLELTLFGTGRVGSFFSETVTVGEERFKAKVELAQS